MNTMLAARLHDIGKPMVLEELPVPEPRPTDVVVNVKACNVVPNLKNVLATYAEWFPYLPLPQLPAIFGLDAAGVVSAVGSHVTDVKVGDRVYVNPGLSCGSCRACRRGEDQNCDSYTFMGYFAFGPDGQRQFDAYPYGGLGEYLTAPQRNLVKLPDTVTFEQGARFGYLGTAYSALRKAGAGPGRTVLIDGISGTLGLGACLIALGLGVSRILGTGRNADLLAGRQGAGAGPYRRARRRRRRPRRVGPGTQQRRRRGHRHRRGRTRRTRRILHRCPRHPPPRRDRRRHRRNDGTSCPGPVLDDVLADQPRRQPLVLHQRSPGHGRNGRLRCTGPLGPGAPHLPARQDQRSPRQASPHGTAASPTSSSTPDQSGLITR